MVNLQVYPTAAVSTRPVLFEPLRPPCGFPSTLVRALRARIGVRHGFYLSSLPRHVKNSRRGRNRTCSTMDLETIRLPQPHAFGAGEWSRTTTLQGLDLFPLSIWGTPA